MATTKTYEAMFLFPAGAAAELEKSVTTARTMIERHGGKIIVIKKWDERKLAYEVKGQKRGVYVIAYFTAPGAAVSGIERDVNLSEDVLRVLVTASAETRIRRVAELERLVRAEAERRITTSDRERQEYFQRFYKLPEEMATHYDLVINTDVLTTAQAVATVLAAAQAPA